MTKLIEVQHQDGITTLSLNRTDRANALNPAYTQEILDQVQQVAEDPDCRLLVFRANGPHFCAGADLTPELMQTDIQQFLNRVCKPLVLSLAQMEKPVISAVNGSAAGIGAALALAADLCVMADDAELFFSFSNLNLVPDGGLSWMLQQQLGRKRAYQLIAEGGRLSAQRCLELGLCNRVVAASELHLEADQWARQLAQRSPLSLRLSKTLMNSAENGATLAEVISQEAQFQRQCQLSEDFMEAIRAFQEKRAPIFRGC